MSLRAATGQGAPSPLRGRPSRGLQRKAGASAEGGGWSSWWRLASCRRAPHAQQLMPHAASS
eukprot:501772-Alexandrium_andersonii.AAC.1